MPRWVLPAVLAVAMVASAALAVRADAVPSSPPAIEQGRVVTPVLSARRVPQWLQQPTGDTRLDEALAAFIQTSPPDTCLVVSQDERPILSLDAEQALVPASNAKLLVAAAALDQMGPDATFRTMVGAESAPADGVVEGDLWFVGGGDPIIATDDYLAGFEEQPQINTDLEVFADQIVEAGITTVTGDVLGDDSRYDPVRTVETWPDRGLVQSRPGPLTALSVNDGFDTYATDPDAVRTPQPADDPPAWAAEVLIELLEERGVEVEGSAGSGLAPTELSEIAVLESPPLREVVTQMLSQSDNTTAELLLKEVGLQRLGQGTTEGGIQAVGELLAERDLPLEGVELHDGSGLHDETRVTCGALIALLQQEGSGSDLAAALAIGGETGTLRERFTDEEVVGRLRGKSGTLNEASSLSGFVATGPGQEVIFAYIANAEEIDEDDIALQEDLVAALVTYPDAPPVSELEPAPAAVD